VNLGDGRTAAPMPTALMAGIDLSACRETAIEPSDPSAVAAEPRWQAPCTITSKVPPLVVAGLAAPVSISAIISLDVRRRQWSGPSRRSTVTLVEGRPRDQRRRLTEPDDMADDLALTARRKLTATAPTATRARFRGRWRVSRNIAHVGVPVLHEAGEVGVAGGAASHGESRSAALGRRPGPLGLRVHRCAANSPSPCSESAARSGAGVRPLADALSGSARSDSISMPAPAAVSRLAGGGVAGSRRCRSLGRRDASIIGTERLAVRLAVT